MQDRKEYILNKAFEVFMAKGYDSASMTVLQQELKISRGAMYRYFASKDDLFIAVIDKYLFGLLNYLNPIYEDNITVLERIEKSYQHMKKLSVHFDNIESINTKFLNFTAMSIQAVKRYPGFEEKIKTYGKTSLASWERALRNSIAKGEVRGDIDVKIMANLFAKSFNFMESSTPEKKFVHAADGGYKIMKYVYSLIKV